MPDDPGKPRYDDAELFALEVMVALRMMLYGHDGLHALDIDQGVALIASKLRAQGWRKPR